MSERIPYQEGVRVMRVYTDSRFPHVLIANQGGATFNVYTWTGGRESPSHVEGDEADYPFIGWTEVGCFTVNQDDKTGTDEHHAAAFAAQHFDEMEEFYCDCVGEHRTVADLDTRPISGTEVDVSCPNCSRVLGTQWRRLVR